LELAYLVRFSLHIRQLACPRFRVVGVSIWKRTNICKVSLKAPMFKK
jgi:hypothetical protein